MMWIIIDNDLYSNNTCKYTQEWKYCAADEKNISKIRREGKRERFLYLTNILQNGAFWWRGRDDYFVTFIPL